MQWPFGEWGADAVISGHDHTDERLQVGGIPYFVNGPGGKSRYDFEIPLPQSRVRYNQDYGAMRGEVIDHIHLAKPGAADTGSQKIQEQPHERHRHH